MTMFLDTPLCYASTSPSMIFCKKMVYVASFWDGTTKKSKGMASYLGSTTTESKVMAFNILKNKALKNQTP